MSQSVVRVGPSANPVPPNAGPLRCRHRRGEPARAAPRPGPPLPAIGYRRMTTILRREGYCVNHKRIQRLCRDEGLRVLKKAKKRSRVGTSTDGARLRATHPGHVWAIDFSVRPDHQLQDPQAAQHHRRVHQGGPGHRSAPLHHGRRHRRVLESIVAADQGAAPEFIRMDNGPELTANALRDWCRFSGRRQRSTSSRGALGRTRSSSPSTASCVTSCSTSRPSRRSSKPRCWPRTSGSSTTPTDHTRHSAGSRPPSSPSSGAKTKPGLSQLVDH